MKISIKNLEDSYVKIGWEPASGAEKYGVFWSDVDTDKVVYRKMAEVTECEYTLNKASHVPHYLKVVAYKAEEELVCSEVLKTPVKKGVQQTA